MSKTQSTSSKSPEIFNVGKEVLYEDFVDVLEMVNWAGGYNNCVHVAQAMGPSGFDFETSGASSAGPHDLFVDEVNSQETTPTVMVFEIYVEKHVGSFTCAARMGIAASNTVDVYFVWTGDTGTSNAIPATFTDATVGALSATVATTSICNTTEANRWVTCEVKVDHKTGASTQNFIRSISIQESIRTSINDPADE